MNVRRLLRKPKAPNFLTGFGNCLTMDVPSTQLIGIIELRLLHPRGKCRRKG